MPALPLPQESLTEDGSQTLKENGSKGDVSVHRVVRVSLTITCVLGLLLGARPAHAFDIFYVCVGNSQYRSVAKPGVYSFDSVSGGNTSARLVATYLRRIGAQGGILFRSESNRFVTRSQVFDAVKQVIAQAKRRPHPFIVYYFVGHGVSEGIGWNHFSVPSDFVGSPEGMHADDLARTMLSTGELFDLLQASRIPFMMMLDNCYEGERAVIPDNIFSQMALQNIKDTAGIVRYMNEFHEPDIVLYSSKPGTMVPVVQNPLDPSSSLSVGPLARRFLLLVDTTLRLHQDLSIQDFLVQMKSPTLDAKTRPAISFATPRAPQSLFISKSNTPTTGPPPEVTGTGLPRAEFFHAGR